MEDVFLNSFSGRKNLADNFKISESDLDGYNIIVANYDLATD